MSDRTFSRKVIMQVLDSLPDSNLPECRSTFDCFTFVTCDKLSSLVKKIAAKSCSVDPIPANVLMSCFDKLLSVITTTVKALLRCGKVYYLIA